MHRVEFERELEPLCLDQRIGVIPYSPLAAGFLTGKYTRENRYPDTSRAGGFVIPALQNDEKAYDILDEVRRIADARSVPMAHVALAWMLARSSITSPIIGARTTAQLDELLGAADLKLNDDDIQALNKISQDSEIKRLS
jgi:aryl-alcohol dehydrogenase-like predicted oxidoreductase